MDTGYLIQENKIEVVKDSQAIQEIIFLPLKQWNEFTEIKFCAMKLKNVCFVAEDKRCTQE